jgi:hypothetical protein
MGGSHEQKYAWRIIMALLQFPDLKTQAKDIQDQFDSLWGRL